MFVIDRDSSNSAGKETKTENIEGLEEEDREREIGEGKREGKGEGKDEGGCEGEGEDKGEGSDFRCRRCGQEKTSEDLHNRLVRDGISTEYAFLPFVYREKQFCSSCFEWHRKKEWVDRILAVLGITAVIVLMVLGFFPLFL